MMADACINESETSLQKKLLEAKKFLKHNAKEKKIWWIDSVGNLEQFLSDFLGDGILASSENPKCTVLKATNVTFNYYPTTRTLQIQGKKGSEVKSSLIRFLEDENENATVDIELDQSRYAEQDETQDGEMAEELRELESFIDSAAEISSNQLISQISVHSENIRCSSQINEIWKAIGLINSKLEAIQAVSQETRPSPILPKDLQQSELQSKNTLLENKLNLAEAKIKKLEEDNTSLITALGLLNANYLEQEKYAVSITTSSSSSCSTITPSTERTVSQSQSHSNLPSSTNPVIHLDPTNSESTNRESIRTQIDDYRALQREKYAQKNTNPISTQGQHASSSTKPVNLDPTNSESTNRESIRTQIDDYRALQREKYTQKNSNPMSTQGHHESSLIPDNKQCNQFNEHGVDSSGGNPRHNKKKKKKPSNSNTTPLNTDKVSSESKTSQPPSTLEQPLNKKGNRPTSVIVGDSMIKNVQGWKLSKQIRTVVKSFSGASVEDMVDYIKPTIKNQPDEIILHVGTNNLKKGNPREIAEKIVDLGHTISLQSPATAITLSSLITRKDNEELAAKVKQVNSVLHKFAKQNEWNFVNNSNITDEHLNRGGLHLSQEGTKLLAQNYSNHIKEALVTSK